MKSQHNPLFWRKLTIEEDFQKVKSTLMAVSPFISSLLRRARIVLSDEVPTAGVTDDYTIAVNPNFLNSLCFADKTWVLAHETLHIAFNHIKRSAEDKVAWNVAADAVDNHLLSFFIKCTCNLEKFSVTLHHIACLVKKPVEELEAMSVEEIYRLLPKSGSSGGSKGGEGVEVERDLNAKCKGGKVLQEGDPEIYGSGQKDEVAEKWKQAVVKAYAQQKLAGKVPAALKRVVDEILQPKVDWRSLLRQAFTDGLGKTVVSTYKRPSRKFPDAYPGIRRFTFPTVHVLIDTSGSIGEEELTQFVTEVYSLAKMSRVSVRSWDADAYEAIAANTPQQVISKVAQNIRGGGGTMIRPCLRKVLSEMKSKDIVVVLSDGEIYDLDEDETKLLLSEVAAKSSVSIFASTLREVDIQGWRFVKISS